MAQNDRLEIGPLKQELGTHYNGIVSLNAFDFTGAYAYVQAAVPPSTSTQAEMHLTLVKDGSNNYRIFLKGTTIKFEKKVGNTKTLLGPAVTFDSSRVFWRIRHDSTANAIHFETAPSVNGAPGGWTSHVNVLPEFAITSMKLELKAGTDRSETTPPGTVAFDIVKAAK